MKNLLVTLFTVITLLIIPFTAFSRELTGSHQLLLLFSNNVYGELEPCG